MYQLIAKDSQLRRWLLENIIGKGENAGDQHFLLSPQCFLPYQRQVQWFDPHLNFAYSYVVQFSVAVCLFPVLYDSFLYKFQFSYSHESPYPCFPLTLSQTTNIRLFQTERVCRQQILI